MKSKAKEEKSIHDKLLKLLRDHFSEDEEELEEEDMEEEGDPLKAMSLRRSYDYDPYDDEMEEGEEEEEDEEEEISRKPSKDHRKQMAVVLATKKAGRK